jgi:hypothetical protein
MKSDVGEFCQSLSTYGENCAQKQVFFMKICTVAFLQIQWVKNSLPYESPREKSHAGEFTQAKAKAKAKFWRKHSK